MFFTASNFKELKLDNDQAKLIAKIANGVIDRHGAVIYGTRYSDGTLEGFSSKKQDVDMHVAIAVGIQEMGLFQEQDKLVHKTNLTDEDKQKAKDRYLTELERENKQLRTIQKEHDKPKPLGDRL